MIVEKELSWFLHKDMLAFTHWPETITGSALIHITGFIFRVEAKIPARCSCGRRHFGTIGYGPDYQFYVWNTGFRSVSPYAAVTFEVEEVQP